METADETLLKEQQKIIKEAEKKAKEIKKRITAKEKEENDKETLAIKENSHRLAEQIANGVNLIDFVSKMSETDKEHLANVDWAKAIRKIVLNAIKP